jgi:hypothetical protein
MAEGSGLIRRFDEDVIGNGQLDLVDEFVVEDLIDHEDDARAAAGLDG